VQSHTTSTFRSLLAAAPAAIQAKVQTAYRLWAQNPAHPSLRFKKVHGPHSEYEKLLSKI